MTWLDTTPLLPYIQLAMVGLFFFVLYRIEPIEPPKIESRQIPAKLPNPKPLNIVKETPQQSSGFDGVFEWTVDDRFYKKQTI